MSALQTIPSSALPRAIARSIAFVADAWRDLTWKHVLCTWILCVTCSAIEVAAAASNVAGAVPWGPVTNGVLSMQLNGFAVLLAVLVADRGSPAGTRRWWPYVVAVIVGVLVGTTLFWVLSQRVFTIPSMGQMRGFHEGYGPILFRHFTDRICLFGLATSVYVSHRFSAQRIAALHAVQLDGARDERRVIEARLAAMQGRVDPRFLLTTLAQVERLYDVDAGAADRMLQQLTDYLRAAIPPLGDAASTVAREVRLTNAFLNITALRSADRLVVSHGSTALINRARMPPMVLLPLIKRALAHRAERAEGDERFEIDCLIHNDRLLLSIEDHGTGFAPGDADEAEIRRIRARLAALYAESARLTLSATAGRTAALLEIPFEDCR
jgi:hypothetical protein